MAMLIRYADGLADVQAVAALEQVCFSRPWRQIDIAYFTTEQSNVLLVAEEDGEVLGYVGMSMVLDEGQIQNIATAPAARRRGVASALIASLFEVGKSHDLAIYHLEVRASNQAAQALYHKHGFTEVGRRKSYYIAPTEDAVLMTKVVQKA